jgi:glutathione peroxidase-family protein
MSDKIKDFQDFIKQDFDIVKDYKNASKELMTQLMKKNFRVLGFGCIETEKEIIFSSNSNGSLIEYIIFDKDIREGCEIDYEWYFLDINTKEKSDVGVATATVINLVNDTVEKLYSRCEKLGLFTKELTPLEEIKEYVNDTFRQMSYAFNMLDGRQNHLIESRDKILSLVDKALTDYTKQTEMLVELREKYTKIMYQIINGVRSKNYGLEKIMKDITTILEGGKV